MILSIQHLHTLIQYTFSILFLSLTLPHRFTNPCTHSLFIVHCMNQVNGITPEHISAYINILSIQHLRALLTYTFTILPCTHVLIHSLIHCINQVNGISPEHISASSEKSIEEDDEWRLMTEPQVGSIIIIPYPHHVCVELPFCRHTLSYSNRPAHLLIIPWFCCFLLPCVNTHSLSLTFHSFYSEVNAPPEPWPI